MLQGKATFTFGDGETSVVGKYEGVMIPKNALYKFEADQSENLVLLRVGGGARKVPGLSDLTRFGTPKDILQQTTFADGSIKEGASVNNGETSKLRIYAKGNFFAPDDRALSAIIWRCARMTCET